MRAVMEEIQYAFPILKKRNDNSKETKPATVIKTHSTETPAQPEKSYNDWSRYIHSQINKLP